MKKVKVLIITESGNEVVVNSWVQDIIINGFNMMVAGWAGHVYYSARATDYTFTTKRIAEALANDLYSLGLIAKVN